MVQVEVVVHCKHAQVSDATLNRDPSRDLEMLKKSQEV